MIKLLWGDCLDRMSEIPDGSVDLVLADPPYGITSCKWDSVIPLDDMWSHLLRVTKSTAAIVLMASQPFTTTLIASNMKMFKYEWIWDKVAGANFMNLKNRPFKTQEQVLVFSKVADFTFNPIRVPRTAKSLKRDSVGKTHGRKIKMLDVEFCGSAKRNEVTLLAADGLKHPIDIIQFSIHEKGRYKVRYATKKPVALMEYLIKTYTNKGELILDFSMGSGTTGVAAKNLGRDFIGIEVVLKSFEMAKERIDRLQGA